MTQLPDPSFQGLYGDLIMEHYRNPRNRDPIVGAQVEAKEFNPFCGDRVELRIRLGEAGRVQQVSAWSEGCSIIQASTSLMSECLSGMSLDEMDDLSEQFRRLMQRGENTAGNDLAGLQALEVVRQYPVRIKCALLPWTALEEGLEGYRASHTRDQ